MKPQGTSRAQSVTTGTTTRWVLKSRWHGENTHKCGLGVSPSFSDFSIAGGMPAAQLKIIMSCFVKNIPSPTPDFPKTITSGQAMTPQRRNPLMDNIMN
jgi:hypothetical protein